MTTNESVLRQYDRLAEDWRHFNTIAWQLPSVAIAIIAGVLGVAYEFLEGYPRVLFLGLGSAFIFALAIALAKHRFFMDARSQFLQDLESNRLNIDKFPITTPETEHYLEKKLATKDPLFNFLKKYRPQFVYCM
ncbi:MAG: hypothetical protein H3Z50_00300 [archaeon]|nr:hypothetical protein [archaeon]MCP8305865.1 hypothetical protein [archaeon]